MWDNARLIEEIAREVISRLTQQSRLLVVTPQGDQSPDTALALAVLKQSWAVELFNPQSNPSDLSLYNTICFLGMDQDFLVKSALGLADSAETKLMAKALQEGRWVWVIVEAGLNWLLSSPEQPSSIEEKASRYRVFLMDYVERLKTFGVRMGTLADLYRVKPPGEGARQTAYFNQPLLTRQTVEQAAVSTLIVSPKTVVTPLAKDLAKARGITIVTGRGGNE